MRHAQYQHLIEHRVDTTWDRYKDMTREALLVPLKRNSQAGRYLLAGDLAALRRELEAGQTVKDLGKPRVRAILHERFEHATQQP